MLALRLLGTGLLVLWLATGCGGSGQASGIVPPLSGNAVAELTLSAVPEVGSACLYAALTPPEKALWVDPRSFGAIPDDGIDDSAALQRALDGLLPGQWLVVPPGVYEHDRSLRLRRIDTGIWSGGGTLRATNPDDQALLIQADGVSVVGLTLTARTTERKTAPQHSRIAVFDTVQRALPIRRALIRANRIVPDANAGDGWNDSAASAAIFVYRAEDFAVVGNVVERSRADGIHVTAGSRNGRIVGNRIRQTGDDMIGLVSYLGTGDWATTPAVQVFADLQSATARELQLVRNIVVADNDLEGNYWGRGIAIVGGGDLSVLGNRIDNVAVGAGILIARETPFVSWGVEGVRVQGNRISRIQTETPSYMPAGGVAGWARTGHGAIEVHAFLFLDEAARPTAATALGVRQLLLLENSVAGAAGAGVRIGEGSSVVRRLSNTLGLTGRDMTGGLIGPVAVYDVTVNGTAQDGFAMLLPEAQRGGLSCRGLRVNGTAVDGSVCRAPATLEVAGSTVSCP